MNAQTYRQPQEQLVAHKDVTPLPMAKLARRLAGLPKDRVHRVTVWFEGDKPKWTVEEVGKAEG